MATTTYTIAQLTALKANYSKGVLRVREADLTLDFASGEDMKARIDAIENELVACGIITRADTSTGLRTTKARFC